MDKAGEMTRFLVINVRSLDMRGDLGPSYSGSRRYNPEFAKNHWRKVFQFLGSGEEIKEIQFRACFCDLGWGSVNYLEGNFSECKED